jgi:DNA polymerase III delta subunit
MVKKFSMNSKQLRNELKNNRLESIYLFTGEEEGEKEKIVNAILDMVFTNEVDRRNSVGRFHLEDDEFLKAAHFALSQSIFAERSVCLMLNVENLQHTSSNVELLRDVIENLPDSTLLILTSSENRVPGIIPSDVLGRIKVVQFWRYFESDIVNYVRRALRGNGISIEEDAISLMIELLGRDIKKIDGAIEKVVNSGEVGGITREMVNALIEDERDVSGYEFIDSFFKRKEDVYYLLKKVHEEGIHELALLGMITRQADLIEKFHSLTESGISPAEALKRMKIDARRRNNFLEYARENPPEELSRIFPMIYRADVRIKSTNYPGGVTANPIFDLVADFLIGGNQ